MTVRAPLIHWDEVEPRRSQRGEMAAAWRDLGRAAGSIEVGLQRIQIDAGHRSTPAHGHGAQEEIFYVLGGSGLSWQDGATYEVGPGDCIVHLAGGPAHTLIAGEDGLDVLAYGTRERTETVRLPHAGISWLDGAHYTSWTEMETWASAPAERHPWAREEAAGPLPLPDEPSPRPPAIVALASVEEEVEDHHRYAGAQRSLGRSAGAQRTGLNHVVLPPGMTSCPLHCHSAEEELFVVLEGDGVLMLGEREHPIAAGSVIARPAATRVGHALRAGPESTLAYLAYGTRVPADVAYYPRTEKVYLRGVGVMFRPKQLGYYDGEK
jgi:uncharacterized cupin superfamily protein